MLQYIVVYPSHNPKLQQKITYKLNIKLLYITDIITKLHEKTSPL